MRKIAKKKCWPSEQRIKKRADFISCYNTNRRIFTKHFVIFTKTQEEDRWRAGLTVSKKMGNAVRRNRIKRVLREFFRLHGTCLPQRLDIVVVPKKNLLDKTITYHLIYTDLYPILKKLQSLGEQMA